MTGGSQTQWWATDGSRPGAGPSTPSWVPTPAAQTPGTPTPGRHAPGGQVPGTQPTGTPVVFGGHPAVGPAPVGPAPAGPRPVDPTPHGAPPRTPDPGTRPPSRRDRRSGRQREEQERQEGRRQRVVVTLVVTALLAGAAYVVASVLRDDTPSADAPVVATPAVEDFPGPGHGSVRVTITADDDVTAVGTALVEAGVVADADVFARTWKKMASGSVTPGTYELALGMPCADAVTALLDPATKATLTVTLDDGLASWEVLAKVAEKTTIPLAELQAAAKDPAAIGLPEQAGGHVEGWLASGTYEVPSDATAADVLALLVARTVQDLTDRGVDPGLWQSVLTKASLVEREMTSDDYRATFARVVENRLRKERPLEIPATVSYGAGTTSPPTEAMRADTDNPYNTYTQLGLPPTPIATPSAASIDAVLAPADGEWLFWTTVDAETGETLFAATYDEFQELVAGIDTEDDE